MWEYIYVSYLASLILCVSVLVSWFEPMFVARKEYTIGTGWDDIVPLFLIIAHFFSLLLCANFQLTDLPNLFIHFIYIIKMILCPERDVSLWCSSVWWDPEKDFRVQQCSSIWSGKSFTFSCTILLVFLPFIYVHFFYHWTLVDFLDYLSLSCYFIVMQKFELPLSIYLKSFKP